MRVNLIAECMVTHMLQTASHLTLAPGQFFFNKTYYYILIIPFFPAGTRIGTLNHQQPHWIAAAEMFFFVCSFYQLAISCAVICNAINNQAVPCIIIAEPSQINLTTPHHLTSTMMPLFLVQKFSLKWKLYYFMFCACFFSRVKLCNAFK